MNIPRTSFTPTSFKTAEVQSFKQHSGLHIVPSSSTAALGSPEGNVNGLPSIRHSVVRQRVLDLHVQDVQDGATFIVTATCGGHDRQARPDKKDWSNVVPSTEREKLVYEINRLAVNCAHKARQVLQNPQVPILASIVTSGDCYDGSRQLEGAVRQLEKAYKSDHYTQLKAFTESTAAVDAVLFEAGGVSVVELLSVCELCEDLSLPLILSLAVDDEGEVLDPNWKIPFDDLARRARNILGEDFIGLGLNCNSRQATKKALQKDTHQEFRLVYPNQSETNAYERSQENFCSPASLEQEIAFLADILPAHPYLTAIGCCCRAAREGKLLKNLQKLHKLKNKAA